MNKYYFKNLNAYFDESLIHPRQGFGTAQEKMTFRLSIACCAYIDPDHEKNSCGVVTLAFYLLYVCLDTVRFMDDFCMAFEKGLKNAA